MKNIISTVGICFAGLTAVALPASAAARFEVSNGKLFDHSTNLIWSAPSASIAVGLPANGELVSGRRVATYEELTKVLPWSWSGPAQPNSAASTSSDSDFAISISFFSQPTLLGSGPWSCGYVAPGTSCRYIEGFVSFPDYNPGDIFYDQWMGLVKTTNGPKSQMTLTSTQTIGSYTQSRCGGFCGENQFFTVQAVPVPEPSTLGLLIAGLGVLMLRRRSAIAVKLGGQ